MGVTLVEFPYSEFSIKPNPAFPSGRVALRPTIPATLVSPFGTFRCVVCVDSGADTCLFPAKYAAELGLDILKMPTTSSIGVGGGGLATHYDNLTIDLGYGIRFKSFVGFTTGLDDVGLGLLGQAGFFEYYTVRFNHTDRKFAIETIDTPGDPPSDEVSGPNRD